MKPKSLPAMLCAMLTCYTINSNAQADQTLSNLTSPTAINQHLLPGTDNKKDLGSTKKSWRKIYFDSELYLKGTLAMHSPGTGNFFTGNGAGNLSLTGSNNTGVGQAALASNTTGSYNTATGFGALLNNTTGFYNTANGYYSLLVNTGYSNTANGYSSLYSNTDGGDNTATGVNAMYNNQTGSYNTATGRFSMFSNTTGSSNIAIGANALFSNTAGYSNVAVGSGALYKNAAGSNLVAVGDSALYNNRGGLFTGNYNVALGSKALYSNTSGSENTANGFYALYSNTDGSQNTGNGSTVLSANTTGYSNTASGYNALSRNINGHNNTAVGVFSGSSTDGSISKANNYCSFFGSYAAQTASMDFTNSMALGNTATITASNQVRIGNGSITSIGGWEPWTDLSDARFKKNLKENVPGLEFINGLRPVTYTMDVTRLRTFLGEDRLQETNTAEGKIVREKKPEAEALVKKGIEEKEKIVRTGFVAQEVEAAAKKIGYDFNGVDKPQNEYTPYGLRYSEFVVPLVKAVQELSKMNDELKKQNEEQQKQIDEMKAMITGNTKNNITLSNASLGQNVPNPFNKATVINYTLPQQFVDAQIVITDNNGKMLKQINISGSGNGTVNIDAATLATGAYSYALYIDKKLIASRQMVLTK